MCMTFVTIFSYNIIQAIIGWILVFIGVGLVLMCMGLEYLAFLTFVIYVGAISIIFLFVVMLLDIRNLESQNRFLEYCIMLIFIIFFFLQIVIVLKSNFEMNISNYSCCSLIDSNSHTSTKETLVDSSSNHILNSASLVDKFSNNINQEYLAANNQLKLEVAGARVYYNNCLNLKTSFCCGVSTLCFFMESFQDPLMCGRIAAPILNLPPLGLAASLYLFNDCLLDYFFDMPSLLDAALTEAALEILPADASPEVIDITKDKLRNQ